MEVFERKIASEVGGSYVSFLPFSVFVVSFRLQLYLWYVYQLSKKSLNIHSDPSVQTIWYWLTKLQICWAGFMFLDIFLTWL